MAKAQREPTIKSVPTECCRGAASEDGMPLKIQETILVRNKETTTFLFDWWKNEKWNITIIVHFFSFICWFFSVKLSGSSFRGESLYSAITQKQSHDSMTFVSRAESVNTKNASSNSNGGGVISFPTLYYDIEQAHSDSSSFDEESASPDYKIKYSGTSRVADSHEASQALSDTINATGSKRRRQMFTSLVQYLIWRRPSQDSGRAIGMTTTQTTVIDKHFLADSPIASSRLATLTHDQGCDNIFDIRYRCNRDGMNSASTSPETGESADGMVKLAVGDDNDGEVVTITDELSEYMEEIRLRELKLKYRLGRGRQAI